MSNTNDSTINDTASQAAAITGAAGEGNAAAHGDASGDGDTSAGDAGTKAQAAAGNGEALTGDAGAQDGTKPAQDAPTGAQGDGNGNAGALKASTSVAALEAGAGGLVTDPVQGLSLGQIVTMVITLAAGAANLVAPGATLAGMTIAQLAKLAVGVAQAAPAAVDAFEQIKQAASSGLPPTQEQWDAWNAAADLAHADLQEAAAAVR